MPSQNVRLISRKVHQQAKSLQSDAEINNVYSTLKNEYLPLIKTHKSELVEIGTLESLHSILTTVSQKLQRGQKNLLLLLLQIINILKAFDKFIKLNTGNVSIAQALRYEGVNAVVALVKKLPFALPSSETFLTPDFSNISSITFNLLFSSIELLNNIASSYVGCRMLLDNKLGTLCRDFFVTYKDKIFRQTNFHNLVSKLFSVLKKILFSCFSEVRSIGFQVDQILGVMLLQIDLARLQIHANFMEFLSCITSCKFSSHFIANVHVQGFLVSEDDKNSSQIISYVSLILSSILERITHFETLKSESVARKKQQLEKSERDLREGTALDFLNPVKLLQQKSIEDATSLFNPDDNEDFLETKRLLNCTCCVILNLVHFCSKNTNLKEFSESLVDTFQKHINFETSFEELSKLYFTTTEKLSGISSPSIPNVTNDLELSEDLSIDDILNHLASRSEKHSLVYDILYGLSFLEQKHEFTIYGLFHQMVIRVEQFIASGNISAGVPIPLSISCYFSFLFFFLMNHNFRIIINKERAKFGELFGNLLKSCEETEFILYKKYFQHQTNLLKCCLESNSETETFDLSSLNLLRFRNETTETVKEYSRAIDNSKNFTFRCNFDNFSLKRSGHSVLSSFVTSQQSNDLITFVDFLLKSVGNEKAFVQQVSIFFQGLFLKISLCDFFLDRSSTILTFTSFCHKLEFLLCYVLFTRDNCTLRARFLEFLLKVLLESRSPKVRNSALGNICLKVLLSKAVVRLINSWKLVDRNLISNISRLNAVPLENTLNPSQTVIIPDVQTIIHGMKLKHRPMQSWMQAIEAKYQDLKSSFPYSLEDVGSCWFPLLYYLHPINSVQAKLKQLSTHIFKQTFTLDDFFKESFILEPNEYLISWDQQIAGFVEWTLRKVYLDSTTAENRVVTELRKIVLRLLGVSASNDMIEQSSEGNLLNSILSTAGVRSKNVNNKTKHIGIYSRTKMSVAGDQNIVDICELVIDLIFEFREKHLELFMRNTQLENLVEFLGTVSDNLDPKDVPPMLSNVSSLKTTLSLCLNVSLEKIFLEQFVSLLLEEEKKYNAEFEIKLKSNLTTLIRSEPAVVLNALEVDINLQEKLKTLTCNHSFLRATEKLSRLKSHLYPHIFLAELLVSVEMVNNIGIEIEEHVSADLFVPLLTFALCYSKIDGLFSLTILVRKLTGENYINRKGIYYLASLEIALKHLGQLKFY
eukprot:snap_masked-scaffold_1-processed-gene-23.51-mRNA-1 protein AED:1.00 eAED:1.00 QI:0/0/0/0/1/1/2/0/1210